MIHRHETGCPLLARDTPFFGETRDFLKISRKKHCNRRKEKDNRR
jgi:hypothetical protein